MDDQCNVPYAMLFVSLVLRCGYSYDSKLHVCVRCQSIGLYAMFAEVGLVLSVPCALAYIMHKHRLNIETISRTHIENIGDIFECVGAMCDVLQLKPRLLQATLCDSFPLAAIGARSFDSVARPDIGSESFFRFVVQFWCTFVFTPLLYGNP